MATICIVWSRRFHWYDTPTVKTLQDQGHCHLLTLSRGGGLRMVSWLSKLAKPFYKETPSLKQMNKTVQSACQKRLTGRHQCKCSQQTPPPKKNPSTTSILKTIGCFCCLITLQFSVHFPDGATKVVVIWAMAWCMTWRARASHMERQRWRVSVKPMPDEMPGAWSSAIFLPQNPISDGSNKPASLNNNLIWRHIIDSAAPDRPSPKVLVGSLLTHGLLLDMCI